MAPRAHTNQIWVSSKYINGSLVVPTKAGGDCIVWDAVNSQYVHEARALVIHNHAMSDVTGLISALSSKLDTSLKGIANGLAELDSNGFVKNTQLPSYVDDVIECANYAALPATGEAGKIYITTDDNKTYRWAGTTYAVISDTLALGETYTTAYRGDRGKIAYDYSQVGHVTLADSRISVWNAAYTHSQLADGSNPHATTFENIGSKPTTVSGYGITDVYTKTESDNKFLALTASGTNIATSKGYYINNKSFISNQSVAGNADNIVIRSGGANGVINIYPAISNTASRFYITPFGTPSGTTGKFDLFNTDYIADGANYNGTTWYANNVSNTVFFGNNRLGTAARLKLIIGADFVGSSLSSTSSRIDFNTDETVNINQSGGGITLGTGTPDPFGFSIANQYTFKNPATNQATRVNIVGNGTASGILAYGTSSIRNGHSSMVNGTSDYVIALNKTNSGTTLTDFFRIYGTTGNLALQDGGYFIDNGYRLQVYGNIYSSGITRSIGNVVSDGYFQGTTAKFTNLTDGKIPYHVSDASGLADAPMTVSGNNVSVTGSFKVGDDATAASSANVGAMRYRVSGNNSYFEMVMQTGASTYAWVVIKSNTW